MRDKFVWWITTVYGLQSTTEKIQFLGELAKRISLCFGDDFNIILRASQKNNENLHRRNMVMFK
jgi:hypothetical protein